MSTFAAATRGKERQSRIARQRRDDQARLRGTPKTPHESKRQGQPQQVALIATTNPTLMITKLACWMP